MNTRQVRTSAPKTFFAHCRPATWRMGSLLGLLLLWPLPAAAQTTPPEGVIQSETRIVLVNVVAKDKHGKPVEDLRRDDFGLLDNNQEQKIALFARESAGAKLRSAFQFAGPPDVHQPAGIEVPGRDRVSV